MPNSRFSRTMSSSISSTMLGWMPSVGSSSSNNFGIGGERARDGELLLLAARQARRRADRGSASDRGTAARTRSGITALAVAAGEGAHQDVLADREVRNDLAPLRHIGDAERAPGGTPAAALMSRAAKHDAAGACGRSGPSASSASRSCRRRCARALAVIRPIRHVERDTVQDVAAAVETVDVDVAVSIQAAHAMMPRLRDRPRARPGCSRSRPCCLRPARGRDASR